MGKVIDAIQLFILFPMENSTEIQTIKDRINPLKEWLYENNWVEDATLLEQHPDYVKVFSDLEVYQNLPTENHSTYDAIKRKLVEMWGENWFYYFVQNTYFLHQNSYLIKHGIKTNTRESSVS